MHTNTTPPIACLRLRDRAKKPPGLGVWVDDALHLPELRNCPHVNTGHTCCSAPPSTCFSKASLTSISAIAFRAASES